MFLVNTFQEYLLLIVGFFSESCQPLCSNVPMVDVYTDVFNARHLPRIIKEEESSSCAALLLHKTRGRTVKESKSDTHQTIRRVIDRDLIHPRSRMFRKNKANENSTKLFDHVAARRWEKAIKRCLKCPHEAAKVVSVMVDESGSKMKIMPLQLACFLKPPVVSIFLHLRVVETLHLLQH